MADPRLRQVALVAADLHGAMEALRDVVPMGEPFKDPGVGEFGLENAVFAVGDTFIEIVSPVRDDTTAGRYLAKRGGDSGYMALFQVADTPAARARAADRGVRIVWKIDLPDISGTHFHPKDVPGAIVSVDTPLPPETWRWGGPAWTGGVPPHDEGGIVGLTVECAQPEDAAATWAALVDAKPDGRELALAEGTQRVVFTDVGARGEGIAELVVVVPGAADRQADVAGVSIRVAGQRPGKL
ncbi:MAG: VOC family protein [Actinobacteria bacterium]|nr:VOC family protein [Actinomycetota bacterium]MBV8960947.1 VOC family protein [Actinomycetota bacterium]MBV9253278.1 VOC family protein [Actinomycetota bacterium]MBV9665853.1 VOC family protein [Actinomycetota bacterium]